MTKDPSKCWHCGEPLHQGHFCEGMQEKAAQTTTTRSPGDAGERAREMVTKFCKRPGCSFATDITDFVQSERTAAASQTRRETMLECAEIAKKHRSEAEMERHKTPDQESKACWLWAFDTSNAIEREIRALATSQE